MNKNQSCLFLYGDEKYLIAQYIKQKIQEVVVPGTEAFGLDKLYNDASLEAVVQSISSQPFLCEQKLVVLYDYFPKDETIIPILINTLLTRDPATHVVFAYIKEIDRRQKWFKDLKPLLEEKECKAFAPWESERIIQFIQDNCRQRKVEIEYAAANILAELVGNNLQQLDSELSKCQTYIGSATIITEKAVRSLITRGQYSTFDLIASLHNKKAKLTLDIVGNLLENGEEFFMLLGFLLSQVRFLLVLKDMLNHGKKTAEIAGILKKNPKYIEHCKKQTTAWKIDCLKKLFLSLVELDYQVKSGLIDPTLGIEMVLIERMQ